MIAASLVMAAACESKRAREMERAPVAPARPASPEAGVRPRDAGAEAGTPDAAVRRVVWFGADAGAAACKLLRPPMMQSYGGPAAIRLIQSKNIDLAQLIFNEDGRPRFSDIPRQPIALTTAVMPPKSALPGCALARDVAFCADGVGAIRRTVGAVENDTVVAQSRPGTPLAAAPIGEDRVVLAFLQEETTSEGLVRQARVMLDGGKTFQLSEEGSGATSVQLVARGEEVLALTIDGRVAMTPAHVRVLRLAGDTLKFGRDAVIFVGGAAERHNAGVLAFDKEGVGFALIPVSESSDAFGMAAVRLSQPPTEDEPVAWSRYPNGLDPAPIAASHGLSPIRVALVRPLDALPDSPRVLEVGELDGSSKFASRCILSEAEYIKDVTFEIDRQGAMWIFWRDTHGSHLERRALPPPLLH
jgi:hypothetical protein